MSPLELVGTILGSSLAAATLFSMLAGYLGKTKAIDELKMELDGLKKEVVLLSGIQIELRYVKENLQSLCQEFKDWRHSNTPCP